MNKNKNKFEPIKINIKGQKLFADVAFAIDSPYFIKRAQVLRKKYKITSPLRDKDCHLWVAKNIVEKKGKETAKKLFEEIDDIRSDMNLTVNYGYAFIKAVFGCNIQKLDYKSTYLINFQDPPKYFYYSIPLSELDAIVLTPQSRKKDVIKLFDEYKNTMKVMKKDSNAQDIFDDYKDTQGNIKRDREWYWKKRKGKTYLQVALEDKERCGIDPEDYKETVRKAIKAYEKLLQPAV